MSGVTPRHKVLYGIVTLTAAFCCALYAQQPGQPPSQEFMVRILESQATPADVKLQVLREVRKIKPQDREPVLVKYIREEAARWQRYYDEGYQASRGQVALPATRKPGTRATMTRNAIP
jgi:hypothetical protein